MGRIISRGLWTLRFKRGPCAPPFTVFLMFVCNVCVQFWNVMFVWRVLFCRAFKGVWPHKHAGCVPSSTHRERSHKVSQGSRIGSLAWAAALENGWQRAYIYIHMYIYIYTYIHIHIVRERLDLWIFIHICIFACI